MTENAQGGKAGKGPFARSFLLLPLLALLALAVYSLVAPAFRPAAPTEEEWLEAAKYVSEHWQGGDVVRIEPAWLTAGRVFFADLDGGKREPFRILDIHDPVDHPFLYLHARLWLVTAVEQRGVYESTIPPGAELAEEIELDGITLLLFDLPGDVVRWSMLASPRNILVERVDPKKGPVRCEWRAGKHNCGIGSSYDVKQELRRVAGGPRACLVVRPGPGKSPVTLTLRGIDREGTLVVRMGNTVEAARAKHGGDVSVTVALARDVVGEIEIERRSYELQEVRATIETATEKELAITVRATDDRKREVCLDGYLLDADVY